MNLEVRWVGCDTVDQGSHSHGKTWKSMGKNLVMESHGKVMENGQTNKVMEILKKSWNFFTADHESRRTSSDNSISTGDLSMRGFRFMF